MLLRHIVGIVSGGASGLGAATAQAIVRLGGRVVVADLPDKKEHFLRLAAAAGIALTDGFSHDGPVLAFAETDIRDEHQVSAALDMAQEKFGEPVNAAISCAGVAPGFKTLSKKMSSTPGRDPLTLFSNALQINAVGTFNLARLSAERMANRDPDSDGMRGCIVNTASIAAFEGQVGQVAYAASKGAVVAMTLPMARDLAPYGIRVMTVAPGLFKTPLLDGLPDAVQTQLAATIPCPARLGDPAEFAQLVVSILTNPMLNGECIRLDGALRMQP